MSRIAGIVSPRPDLDRLVAGMLEAIRSRPDWNLVLRRPAGAALGWTGWSAPRLAEREGLAVVLDGAVHNRAELGEGTDAEIVLELVARHGFVEALRRINGDFALAVWDERDRTLWLGRDRVGVKPLYYARTGDLFAFGSRPAALLALPGADKTPNRRFLALFGASHYRVIDNAREESPYAAVSQLPAGCALRWRQGEVLVQSYWSLAEAPDWSESEAELAERYRELLLDAVAIRLKGAAAPAFTLSGGMDSSSVLASAGRVSGRKQVAFSTVYSDKTFDESEEIRSMLDAAVERWRPVAVDDIDPFAMIERLVRVHDEPVATATWLSHDVLCERVAAEGFGTLFGGLGGDELNAGEYEYFLYRFADLRRAGDEAALAREIDLWAAHHDHPVWRKNAQVVEAGLARLTDPARPGRIRPDRARIERYAAALHPEFFDLRAFEPVMDHPFSSWLKNRAYQDMFRETAPCCLRAEDRQTTHRGLDHVLPFFDHRLIEFMFRVPGSMKIRDGVTKRLLREAMRGILPEETRTRIKKTGWNAPAHVWFSGPGRERLLDLVGSRSFRERGIYDPAETRRLIDEHEEIVTSGRAAENHMMFLWQLVNLEIWLRSLEG